MVPTGPLRALSAACRTQLLLGCGGSDFRANHAYARALSTFASYEKGVCASDRHVSLLWLCIHEMSADHMLCFLERVWGRPACAELLLVQAWPYDTESLVPRPPFPFKVLLPSAVGKLMPDSAEMAVFPDGGGLSLPRYSSLRVLVHHMENFLAGPDGDKT